MALWLWVGAKLSHVARRKDLELWIKGFSNPRDGLRIAELRVEDMICLQSRMRRLLGP